MLMYVTRVPNRGSPPAILLRESYRDGDKVKTRTLANLSRWPEAKIEALRRVLKGAAVVAPAARLAIERSLPHGHVAAVLGMARKLGLERLLPRRPERLAKLALALIVARVLEPAAKLATARQLSEASAAHSLGAVLGLAAVDEDELYRALDLLGEAQPKIEADLKPAGLDWITALRAPAVQALVAEDGPLQLSLFDQRDIAEIASPDYPGERLVVCKNPDLAAERARKRADLLAATERDLARIRAAVERERRPLRGRDAIAPAPPRPDPRRSPPPGSRPPLPPRPPAGALPTASRRTPCAPCSRTWRPSPATPSASATPRP